MCPAGHLYPMEAHLVSVIPQSSLPACPPEGCVVVTAVMFELSDDLTTGSSWLEPLFAAMPLNEGVSGIPCAHLQSLCGHASELRATVGVCRSLLPAVSMTQMGHFLHRCLHCACLRTPQGSAYLAAPVSFVPQWHVPITAACTKHNMEETHLRHC